MSEIIKKSDVKELLKDKVINEVALDFERGGFKYLKSSNSFVREIDLIDKLLDFIQKRSTQ